MKAYFLQFVLEGGLVVCENTCYCELSEAIAYGYKFAKENSDVAKIFVVCEESNKCWGELLF